MMSEGTDRITTALNAEHPVGSVDEPMEVLHALGDEKACRVLQAVSLPKTVARVAGELEMPQSTTYRKISMLEDLGLVRAENPSAASNVASRYHRPYGEICVRLEPEIHVELR